MPEWRSKALELLPEMSEEIHDAESPMALWIDIVFEFDQAYLHPRDEDFIRRVYEFESWCLEQDGGETADEHLPTCVVVTLWEHIPTNPDARKDMPRWFSLDDVIANSHFFSYHLDSGNFESLLDDYKNTDLKLVR